MTKKVLITDSFFITDEHIAKLKDAGYEVVHLDTPAATEDELISAIQGISVYILGGIEQVTNPVVLAADTLEAIIFCGVDYDKFIPAAELATTRGIKIYNVPGSNAVAVAEFAIGTALFMQRQLIGISRSGDEHSISTESIQNSVVGVIGAGTIGKKIIEAVQIFAPSEVLFYNRSPKDLSARQVDLDELIAYSDIIFLALPMRAGLVLDAKRILAIKRRALLVSISPMSLVDIESLTTRLLEGTVRTVIDWPAPSKQLAQLPLETFYSVNSHSAYNTKQAIEAVANRVMDEAIRLL